jgi:hypothetical protein
MGPASRHQLRNGPIDGSEDHLSTLLADFGAFLDRSAEIKLPFISEGRESMRGS